MTKIFPISRYIVSGNSMLPTFHQGQNVISFNWAYLGRKPKIGDIVVVKMQDKEIVKRVQKIEGRHIFVTGDNSKESTDSKDFGMVNMDQVIGKIVYSSKEVDCSNCGSAMVGIAGRKDAICQNCGFKLTCCGEP